jgi:hypothetical protein
MSVNLQKGQKISLEKEAGGALSRVTMGLGWDVAKEGLLRLRRRQGQPRRPGRLGGDVRRRQPRRSTWSGSAS